MYRLIFISCLLSVMYWGVRVALFAPINRQVQELAAEKANLQQRISRAATRIKPRITLERANPEKVAATLLTQVTTSLLQSGLTLLQASIRLSPSSSIEELFKIQLSLRGSYQAFLMWIETIALWRTPLWMEHLKVRAEAALPLQMELSLSVLPTALAPPLAAVVMPQPQLQGTLPFCFKPGITPQEILAHESSVAEWQLVGVLTGSKTPLALLALASKQTITVALGSSLGKEGARVTAIAKDHVEVTSSDHKRYDLKVLAR